MPDAVIVDALRTPHGRRGGSLAEKHPVDLLAHLLNALVNRTGLDPAEVDDVIVGCVTQLGDQSSNIARFAVLAAGWPESVPGVTINRACGSSQQALDFAANAVMAGVAETLVVGGVESMSRVPLGAAREVGLPYGPQALARYGDWSFNQGLSAEMIAQKWAQSRRELDEFAMRSHELAAAALDRGDFLGQVVPVHTAAGDAATDECVRRGTNVEILAGLQSSFTPDGVIHAGNSSQISDGAAVLLVTTPGRAAELGLTPLVRYHTGAVSGADPVLMLTAPIPATQRVLKRSGVALEEIGIFEVNEAFAPVPLAWATEVGVDLTRVNPQGGAIALGHPLGATGASLMTRMVHWMRDKGTRFGLQTMCEGGGTANATLVELVDRG